MSTLLCSLCNSIAVSPKGYTDSKICLVWFKQFELDSHEKAAGKYHVLFLDGHGSHMTLKMIEYAMEHRIVLACSPPHSTHIYQVLDVGIFGVLKSYWGEVSQR